MKRQYRGIEKGGFVLSFTFGIARFFPANLPSYHKKIETDLRKRQNKEIFARESTRIDK